MANVVLTITIPEEKATKALEGFLKLYPNTETKPDPTWVDPQDGTEAPQIPKYTNKQWVQEKLRKLLIRECHRGLQMIANASAIVAVDDNLAT